LQKKYNDWNVLHHSSRTIHGLLSSWSFLMTKKGHKTPVVSSGKESGQNRIELDFLTGHIAATMALIQGLIQQGSIDQKTLDAYFEQFSANLPHTKRTLALRIILDQWRQNLGTEEEDTPRKSEVKKRRHLRLIKGGGA
jgi:hypothetical protein